eukprot:TRINITY_DN225_c0_g1_i1.p1 TRINITY_DN225_c0_g1~~TRINITY_DN225_c0_g1_i1.p1  ORF type:complete len:698 (+),score=160.68 TRINITY_DN225_c0_g1_i1:208-2301(+)
MLLTLPSISKSFQERQALEARLFAEIDRTADAMQDDGSATLQQLAASLLSVGEVRNHLGQTPLLSAIAVDNSALASKLIASGANVNAQDTEGHAPLHAAASTNNVNLVRQLLAAGAACDTTTVDGNTPLHLAAVAGAVQAVEVLLSVGRADPRLANADICTPLHLAVTSAPRDVVHDLVALLLTISYTASSPIDTQNAKGRTALHEAARLGLDSIVDFLCAKQADLSVRDVSGNTALHYAAQLGDPKVASILLARGAQQTLHNLQGQLPCDLVSHSDVAHVLPKQEAQQQQRVEAQRNQIMIKLQGNRAPYTGQLSVVRTPPQPIIFSDSGVAAEAPFIVAYKPISPLPEGDSIESLVVVATLFDFRGFPLARMLRGGAEQLKRGLARFGSLAIVADPSQERFSSAHFLQFTAYTGYQTDEQLAVAISERVPISIQPPSSNYSDARALACWLATGMLSAGGRQNMSSIEHELRAHWKQLLGYAPNSQARTLSDADLLYLRTRLAVSAGDAVSFDMFRKDVYQLLHAAAKTVASCECLRVMWNQDLIYGFADRHQSAEIMRTMAPGTVLVRFSESSPGCLVIESVSAPSPVSQASAPSRHSSGKHSSKRGTKSAAVNTPSVVAMPVTQSRKVDPELDLSAGSNMATLLMLQGLSTLLRADRTAVPLKTAVGALVNPVGHTTVPAANAVLYTSPLQPRK